MDLHLRIEVAPDLSLREVQRISDEVERSLLAEIQDLRDVAVLPSAALVAT